MFISLFLMSLLARLAGILAWVMLGKLGVIGHGSECAVMEVMKGTGK